MEQILVGLVIVGIIVFVVLNKNKKDETPSVTPVPNYDSLPLVELTDEDLEEMSKQTGMSVEELRSKLDSSEEELSEFLKKFENIRPPNL